MAKDAGGITLSEVQIGSKAPCPLLANVDRSHTSMAYVLDIMQTAIEALGASSPDTTGTVYTHILVEPAASTTVGGAVTRNSLFGIGDVTGTTAYGMGDPLYPTYGLYASFGRTVVASGDFTDTSLSIRAINKLVNTGSYNLEGAFIKAKNYTAGTVVNLIGVHVEVVDDGTTTLSTALEIGADSSTVNEGIVLDNGTFTVGIDLTDSCTTGIDIGACATGITFTGACTTAAISMNGGTFAAGDHEIEMRNNVSGDKTVICSGAATDDAGIVTAVGADADIADGSIYMSCTDGAGALFVKINDTWTALTT